MLFFLFSHFTKKQGSCRMTTVFDNKIQQFSTKNDKGRHL
ncbi:hypothetical protein GS8_190 [Geobacillus stearothermophilus]|uniref:Uncharacterized protein n=1 Tax=Geobacillus stearothermophilus TaxID=1422 RepID=A0A150M8Y4_GEOSE|nr:hypothetical protein GS8_190 [Geobacillus stearothermophilus]KYD20851.1 hypothetical protein B4109_0753 [Geobacillus stearothermophilus]